MPEPESGNPGLSILMREPSKSSPSIATHFIWPPRHPVLRRSGRHCSDHSLLAPTNTSSESIADTSSHRFPVGFPYSSEQPSTRSPGERNGRSKSIDDLVVVH